MKIICLLQKNLLSLFSSVNPQCAKDEGEVLELISGPLPCMLALDAGHCSAEFLQAVKEKNRACLILLASQALGGLPFPEPLSPSADGILLFSPPKTVDPTAPELLRDILSSEYVKDLIYGHPERLSKLHSLFQLMNLPPAGMTSLTNLINLKPQIVFTVVFDNFWTICETRDNSYRYRLKRLLLNSTRKILDRDWTALAATLTGTDKVVVLLDCRGRSGGEAEDYAKRCAEVLLAELKQITGYSVSIGVSDYCAAPPLLDRYYEQSFRALEQSFQAGPGQILRACASVRAKEKDSLRGVRYSYAADNLPGGEKPCADENPCSVVEPHTGAKVPLPIHEQGKRDLIIAVTEQDDEGCKDILDRLCAEYSMQNADSSYIKSLVVSMLSEIARYCSRMGLDPRTVSEELLSITSSVFKSNTLSDVKKEAYQFLNSLSHRLKSEAPESTPLDMAAAYLEQYYINHPGLNEMAELCGYSPSYFSRAFKERFGVNFVRYLKDLQVKNAKKLLRESSLTLAEISEKTGFQSLSYFSSAFKKETGISPAQYRTLIRE